jgi:hypothetical protein
VLRLIALRRNEDSDVYLALREQVQPPPHHPPSRPPFSIVTRVAASAVHVSNHVTLLPVAGFNEPRCDRALVPADSIAVMTVSAGVEHEISVRGGEVFRVMIEDDEV